MQGSSSDTRIAGKLTVHDWSEFSKRLRASGDEQNWQAAFRDYFLRRISSRYLEPINRLEQNGPLAGEGFSIVAIQCALVEFLAATVQGKNYLYRRSRDPKLTANEYDNSSKLFVDFLSSADPFRSYFDSATADDFYRNVRCPLLHEARTKAGWRIRARSKRVKHGVDAAERIVYRGNLQCFIRQYGEQLAKNPELQAGFIRKFDYLCDL